MADYTFKVIVVGTSGVGKTAVVRRYISRSFNENTHPTIGVDIGIKLLQIDHHKIQLKIWDSAGSERFKSLTTSYYRNADAAILMYGINNAQSLHELHDWSNEVNNHAAVLKILVGNKNDLRDERTIFHETAVNFALMENIDLAVECSAKIDDNVDYIFYTIAKKLLSRRLEEQNSPALIPNKEYQENTLRYPDISPSLDNLFHSPRGSKQIKQSNNSNGSTLRLDEINPKKPSWFRRICSV